MAHYDSCTTADLTNILSSRGLKIKSLRNKSFMVSLLTYLDNEKIQLISSVDDIKYREEIEELQNSIKVLADELNDKNHQLNKMKDNSIMYENLTLEAEEALNKKINEQDELIKHLKNQIINLNTSSETLSCDDCTIYEEKITKLKRDLDLKSIEITGLCAHSEELKNQITDINFKLSQFERAQTHRVHKHIQTDTNFTPVISSIGGHPDEARDLQGTPSQAEIPTRKVTTPNKHKILLLADSQGRKCGEVMNQIFDSDKYDTICFFKPNASFESAVDNVIQQSRNFTKSDFVVILGGSNNAYNQNLFDNSFLEIIKQALTHTNIIIVLPPLWKNNIQFNSYILQNNFNLCSIFKESAYFIDLNSFLTSENFTRHGLHINISGKILFIEKLFAYISHKTAKSKDLFR